ncbi:MAG: diguanylate cyclase domain-containing protein [Marinobacter sp.]
MAISDASFNIVRANPAFAEIAGLPPRKLYGKNLLDFLDGRHGRVPDLEKLRKQLDVRGAWHGEVWMKGTGDKPLPYLLTASPARNPQGELQHFILSLTNITERVEAEKHMHRLAHYDTLTGLPNRTSLENHLGRAIQQARASGHSFAMMFLDLDRFKPVNDTYGHQVGDELLINVARRLSHNLRSCDIVGRQGGDEFVVITGALNSSDEARTIADKVITALNEPFHIQDRHLQIGASVGVALYPDDGQSADELMRKADRAMYKVKNKGRNSVAFA